MLVDFHHLSSSPIERALPAICEQVLAGGGRLLVVADETRLARLDEQLWTQGTDSFLPHGRDRAERQPILLAATCDALNGAASIALADGAWREEALGFDRIYYLFDNERRQEAREAWRALSGREGVETRFWKQDERGEWARGP